MGTGLMGGEETDVCLIRIKSIAGTIFVYGSKPKR